LVNIKGPERISLPGLPDDVGLGTTFAFPFTTIEEVIVFDRHRIGVLNANNFPLSIGHHVGLGKLDDNEFIVVRLDKPLAISEHVKDHDDERWDDEGDDR
jgi:glycerophosphoryl diester phosphodiesterase